MSKNEMNSVKHKNLRELCRACLKSLKNTSKASTMASTLDDNNTDDDDELANQANLLVPNLCQLFLYFTTLDVSKEIEGFPKLLCQLCLSKLMEYDDFRKLTLKSTATLYDMLHGREEKNTVVDQKSIVPDQVKGEKCSAGQHVDVKMEITSTDEDEQLKRENDSAQNQIYVKNEFNYNNYENIDDDQLLLPELANLPLNIKSEPYFEASDTQIASSSFVEGSETSRQFSYNAISSEDDADDEELFLSNGAANTSTSSMYTVERIPSPKRNRNQKKSVYCPTCNKQFYKQFYLEAHVRGVHMGVKKPFRCLKCSQTFTRYNQLYMHKRSQHSDDHIGTEGKEPRVDASMYILPESNEEIEYRVKDRNGHFENEFSQISPDIPQLKEVIPRKSELEFTGDYTCQICSRNYSSPRALNEHMKRHQQIKEYACHVCGIAKVTRTELQTHMRVHIPNLEKFQCPQCPQVFNHKNAISRHVKVVHEGQKRYPCSYCPKRFSTRNSKVCHERLHTGERPFSCHICHKGFVQQESLRSHMKNHDKTLRKHVCSYCSQRFITLKNLMDHERRHLGDKPHICNICSKGFYKAEDLQTHRSSHENINGSNDHNNFEDEQQEGGGFSELEQPTDSGSQSSN